MFGIIYILNSYGGLTMDIQEKLRVLSDAAKYDVSCSSSGSDRKNSPGGIGNAASSGICHSFTEDGRCISLLKILLTNYCVYDCVYCINRSSNDIERAAFTPQEVADLTINFYRRNFIEGLFLSSAVFKNPNYTMELLAEAVRILRTDYRFNGYIHVKAIPGADTELIKTAGRLVDRMSVNIELPSSSGLKLLAPQKTASNILTPMSYINSEIISSKEEVKKHRNAPKFVPAGQSTQLIIGATPDSDLNILNLSENLYKKYSLKRVYYSAYVSVSNNPKLPKLKAPPLLREHRLYQADWLLRFYGFRAGELLNETAPNFNVNFDPKTDWALKHLESFPVEINREPYETLLRVPGIGVKSAMRILKIRTVHFLSFDDLKKIGVVVKRARYFITCRGKYYGDVNFDYKKIEERLLPAEAQNIKTSGKFEQLTFFTGVSQIYVPPNSFSRTT
jgi:putative DNA modification/repair radical SAM protein